MIRALSVVALLVLPLGPAAAGSGDFGYSWHERPDVVFPGPTVRRSPYPMSRASASVWVSDACFRDCTGQAAWRFQACVRKANTDDCRARLDATDRMCQSTCRPMGGPLLNITD